MRELSMSAIDPSSSSYSPTSYDSLEVNPPQSNSSSASLGIPIWPIGSLRREAFLSNSAFTRVKPKEIEETPPPDSIPLSKRLREISLEFHGSVAQHPFVNKLINGSLPKEERLPKAMYEQMLADNNSLYRTLETSLEAHQENPFFAPLFNEIGIRDFYRSDAIEEDIHYFQSEDLLQTAVASSYTSILHELSKTEEAIALVAHAYVHYMGLMFGGKFLMRGAQALFGDGDGHGAKQYDLDFSNFGERTRRFRNGIDKVGDSLSPKQIEVLLAHTRIAYEHSFAIMDAVMTPV
jgi:heme oxygenase